MFVFSCQLYIALWITLPLPAHVTDGVILPEKGEVKFPTLLAVARAIGGVPVVHRRDPRAVQRPRTQAVVRTVNLRAGDLRQASGGLDVFSPSELHVTSVDR